MAETDNPFQQSHFFKRWPEIPHYHGDHVRQIFLSVATLSVVIIPVWGDILPFGLWPQLWGAIFLVLLAGLTGPHSKIILSLDAVAACVLAFLLESAAIFFYSSQSYMLFGAREVSVVLLLFAFYYSVKTLRAMLSGHVGSLSQPGEFESPKK